MKREKWAQILIVLVMMIPILAMLVIILLALFYPVPIEPIGDWGGTNTFH